MTNTAGLRISAAHHARAIVHRCERSDAGWSVALPAITTLCSSPHMSPGPVHPTRELGAWYNAFAKHSRGQGTNFRSKSPSLPLLSGVNGTTRVFGGAGGTGRAMAAVSATGVDDGLVPRQAVAPASPIVHGAWPVARKAC